MCLEELGNPLLQGTFPYRGTGILMKQTGLCEPALADSTEGLLAASRGNDARPVYFIKVSDISNHYLSSDQVIIGADVSPERGSDGLTTNILLTLRHKNPQLIHSNI